MSKILIVEDEEAIAELEKDYLELNDFEVTMENSGDTGLATALSEDFDLIILDLMLPGIDGFEICRRIREDKNVPILMVSAKKDDIDKIRGLGLGADDYLTKPFSPSELVARVKAHMARYERLVGSHTKENDIIEIRGIRIDKTARRVFINDEEKTFTTKELRKIPTMCSQKKKFSAKFGIWIPSATLRRLRFISKKSAKRLKPTPASRSTLRPFGASGIGLKYKITAKILQA